MHEFAMWGFLGSAMFLLFIIVPLALFIWALVDIMKSEFRENNKMIWLILVLFIPMIGAVVYLAVGRKQKITREV